MLFSSTIFIYLFLPLVLFFNFIVFKWSRLLQNINLLFASLFFYAWGEPKYVFLMMGSIVVNWFMGLMISKKRDKQKVDNQSKNEDQMSGGTSDFQIMFCINGLIITLDKRGIGY